MTNSINKRQNWFIKLEYHLGVIVTSCSQKEPECKIKFHLQNLSIFIIYSAEKHIETDLKTYFTDPKLVSVFFFINSSDLSGWICKPFKEAITYPWNYNDLVISTLLRAYFWLILKLQLFFLTAETQPQPTEFLLPF